MVKSCFSSKNTQTVLIQEQSVESDHMGKRKNGFITEYGSHCLRWRVCRRLLNLRLGARRARPVSEIGHALKMSCCTGHAGLRRDRKLASAGMVLAQTAAFPAKSTIASAGSAVMRLMSVGIASAVSAPCRALTSVMSSRPLLSRRLVICHVTVQPSDS